MRYRVTIEIIEDPTGEKPNYEVKNIYEQIVNKLDIWKVIQATNSMEDKLS